MLTIRRTDSTDPDFVELVKHLDKELEGIYGEAQYFYSQFNKIHMIKHAVVAYENQLPVACGAIKEFSPGVMEVKRMYTLPSRRGKGYGIHILSELEKWAAEMAMKKCVLETGTSQPFAVRLYEKCGYVQIPNYGQYAHVDTSVCYEKLLNKDN